MLDSGQQSDQVTKTIQTLLDKAPESDWLRLSDFILVLDKARLEPPVRFDRDGRSGRKISPQVQVVTRQTLADWLNRR